MQPICSINKKPWRDRGKICPFSVPYPLQGGARTGKRIYVKTKFQEDGDERPSRENNASFQVRGHCPPGNFQCLITKSRPPNSNELVARPGGEVFWETPVPPLEFSSVRSLLRHQVDPDHVVQTSPNNSQLHLVTSKRRYHSILCRRTTKIFVTR